MQTDTDPLFQGEAASATGSQDNSPSFAQLYDTFIPVFIVAVITVAVFLILRRILTRNYAPRTFLKSLRPQYVSCVVTAAVKLR